MRIKVSFRNVLILLVLVVVFQICMFSIFLSTEKSNDFLLPLKATKILKKKLLTCPLGKHAKNAFNRAISYDCKSLIISTFCQYQNGTLYPNKLSQRCPFQKVSVASGKYLGCFLDKAGARDLPHGPKNFDHSNSPFRCIEHCFSTGEQFAGLQFGTECWCGSSQIRRYGPASDDSLCQSPCPGEPTAFCGGFELSEIYATGLRKPLLPTVGMLVPANNNGGRHVLKSTRIRIAYLLQLNGRAWRQIVRLFKLLYHTDHFFYIHVDARQNYLHNKILSLSHAYPHNVRVTSWRLSSIWGGASLLDMSIQAHRDLVELAEQNVWKWDFVINISESDLPIKSNEQLIAFLGKHRDKNFIKSHSHSDVNTFIAKQGLNRLFIECDNHMWLIGERTLPQGDIIVDGGSDWTVLNRRFVTMLTHALFPHHSFSPASNLTQEEHLLINAWREYLRYALLPVETFYHTVVQNSLFCDTVINNNLRLTNWQRSYGCRCQQIRVVDWCGCSPNVVTRERMNLFRKSKSLNLRENPLFFMRKFDPVVDQNVINDIELDLRSTNDNTIFSNTSDLRYWENVYDSLYDKLSDSQLGQFWGWLSLASRTLPESCISKNVKPHMVLSSHLYCNHGLCDSILLHWQAELVSGETLFRRIDTFHVLNSKSKSVAGQRLRGLNAGRNFDVKEGLFREYHNLLSPQLHDQFSVVIQWSAGSPVQVLLLIIDPVYRLASLLEVKAEAKHYGQDVQLSLPVPVLPGQWHIVLVDELFEPLAHTEVQVLPLIALAAQPIGDGRISALHNNLAALFINNSIELRYQKLLDTVLAKLKVDADMVKQQYSTLQRLLSSSSDVLQEWLEQLLALRWRPQATCLLTTFRKLAACSRILDKCERSTWSSFAPDPKSALPVKWNPLTGRLWQ